MRSFPYVKYSIILSKIFFSYLEGAKFTWSVNVEEGKVNMRAAGPCLTGGLDEKHGGPIAPFYSSRH